MHKQYLLAALKQAWLGRGVCAPNPSVGAVAVLNGDIIAQAFHCGAGTPHAELLVLEQLPAGADKITLYVTLEPCNHWGRTPPCVDAIIQRGIKHVVYAYKDPNTVVAANNTPQLLSEQGVVVEHMPQTEIDAFYESYHYWTQTQRPWVTVKMAQTFDGKIAGPDGRRVSLSNALCAEFTHQQRAYADIILTTATTVNQDDPLLNVRLPVGERKKPVAILDARGVLHPNARVLQTALQCHVYYAEERTLSLPHSACRYHAVPTHNGELSLEHVLSHLGQLGYHDVWVEAGGRLFSALHRARLVNRTYLYLVPNTLGEAALSAYCGEEVLAAKKHTSFQVMGDNVIACLDWLTEDICLPV